MSFAWFIVLLLVRVPQGAPPSEPYVVEVVNGPVDLVSGADQRFPALAQAKNGDLLVVVDEQAQWSRVQVPAGFSGWVHHKYVDRTGKRGTINARDVNFRAEPSSSTNNLPVGTMAKGSEVFILGEQGDWLRISSPPELTLWVPAQNVKRAGSIADLTPKLQEIRQGTEKRWADTVGAASATAPVAGAAAAATAAVDAEPDAIKHAREQLDKAASDPKVDVAKTRADLQAYLAGPGVTAAQRASAGDLVTRIDEIEKDRRGKALAASKDGGPATKSDAGSPARGTGAPVKATPPPAQAAADLASTAPPASTNPALSPAQGSKYVAVGWVSGARDAQAAIYLRKGGYITFRLSCPDGRYRLHDFLDREVGVTGKVIPTTGIEPMVEVQSIEILKK